MQYVTSIKDIKFLPALSVFLSSWSFPRFLSTVYLVHHQMNNANNETFSFLNPQVFRRLTYACYMRKPARFRPGCQVPAPQFQLHFSFPGQAREARLSCL